MADSSRAHADYARRTDETTSTVPLTESVDRRRFRPRLLPTFVTVLLVPLFLSAGQWQWNKYEAKTTRQAQLDTRISEPEIPISAALVDAQSARYRKVVARGRYDPRHQILIDNHTYRGQAGFHVITPLRIEGSDTRVLVNRGWIPASAEHRQVPEIATPDDKIEIHGTAIVPGTRFLTLGNAERPPETGPGEVWQNLDMALYRKTVRFPIQSIVIQLDPASAAAGFVRDWPRPDDRRQTNLGYALQWWTFAATTVVLWVVMNFRRNS